MRLKGGRTGKRAVVCTDLELTGLMRPFDLEVWYGERVAVLGSNGSGKSHFLRLLAGGGSDPDVEHRPVGEVEIEPVRHTGRAKLGARVRPGWFVQTHEHPELIGCRVAFIRRDSGKHQGFEIVALVGDLRRLGAIRPPMSWSRFSRSAEREITAIAAPMTGVLVAFEVADGEPTGIAADAGGASGGERTTPGRGRTKARSARRRWPGPALRSTATRRRRHWDLPPRPPIPSTACPIAISRSTI